jgi:hypothetical protein
MKRLGPELKMPEKPPELKVPVFVENLYFDLRDRRLLPLVALVVVAIVAVPFLLGGDAEPVPPPQSFVADEEVASGDGASLVVVEANPGLRDYRKRLKGRTPTDPFATQAPAASGGGGAGSDGGGDNEASASAGGGESSSSSGTTEDEGSSVGETVEPVAPPSGGEGGGGNSGGASPGKVDPDDPGLRFFAFRPDIRFGVAGSGELTSHEELPLGEPLPSRNPVVVFIGVSDDGKRVAFDVAPEVAMVKGPGRCIGGPQSCSLLSLKAGEAADIVTAQPGRSFRLKVEKIEFVEVQRPKPAGSSSTAVRQGWGFDLAVVGQFGTGRG